MAKDVISMSGSSYIDSFDSSDPLYSSGGRYDPAKAKDNAYVSTLSSALPAMKLEEVYGYVATGAGATVSVTDGVGTRAWVAANPGTIQPGHFTDDFNLSIPDVGPPFSSGYFAPGPGTVGGMNYLYVLGNGNYLIDGKCTIPGGQAMVVTGDATLYVTSDFTTSGSGYVWLMPGASFRLYVAGAKCTISGGGLVNGTEKANACSIFGLPSCSEVVYSGSAEFIGTVYAPSAKFTLSGGANASGSFLAKTFIMSGGMNVHCDEALYAGGGGGKVQIVSWNEL